MRRDLGLVVAFCLAGTGLSAPPVQAGAMTGAATEWTQLANNVLLGQISATESAALAQDARTLSAELEQVRTHLAVYEVMLRNVEVLPDRIVGDVLGQVGRLHGIAASAGSLAASGAEIDRFLRSDLISDPLFERRGLERHNLAESYNAWTRRWQAAMGTGLGQAGLTMRDVETEAGLLDRISGRMGSEVGQMQVLQASNEIAASLARQMNDLRALTATQNEQVTMAWGRVLADMDQREAARRRHDTQIRETLDQLSEPGRYRSMNEIFGIGQ